MWDVAAAVGGNLLAGMMGADAAENAASIQSAATDRAVSEQRRQFDLGRTDLAPWRDTGSAAINRMGFLLGLGSPSGGASSRRPVEDIARELRASGRFTTPERTEFRPTAIPDEGGSTAGPLQAFTIAGSTDEAALLAEAQRMYAAQAEQSGAQAPGDFGALTRKFTMDDFNADPVTQKQFAFGLSEGEKAVRRMFGARGMSRSGEAVKALTRFATDYTGQQAGASRDRFVQDQTNLYNRLAGVAGTGQTAATNTAQLGAQTSSNIGGMIVGEGNARGAASIARGNAWGSAASNIGNYITGQHTLNTILNRGGTAGQVQPMVAGQFNLDTYG